MAEAETNDLALTDRLPSLPTIATVEEVGIEKWGNHAVAALVKQVAFDDELAALSAAAEETRGFLGFELTKAVMELQEKNDKFNVYAIWEGGKAVEKLNTRFLLLTGVMTKEPDPEEDKIVWKWTDADNEKQYNYSAVDKEKDAAEYKRRFDNRKRLNIALSNAYKAAIALIDGGTKAENLSIVQEEGKAPVAQIANAPKDIAGEDTAKPVQFGKRTVATGASHSPTMASLVKIATQKHKTEDLEQTGERSDKGAERSGEAKLNMSDEDFGAMINTLKRSITAQEGVFSADKLKQVKSLIPVLQKVLDEAAAKKAEADAVKAGTAKPDKKKAA